MKTPLVCKYCEKPLDEIWNPDDEYDKYHWDSEQRKYVFEQGTAHMECPHCGSTLRYNFNIPEEFSISHEDQTDSVEDEEVNVNGTVTTNAPLDSEAAIDYIKEEYELLLNAYPDLKVTILEQGERTETQYFTDYCIEPEDGYDMATIIQWWRQHR